MIDIVKSAVIEAGSDVEKLRERLVASVPLESLASTVEATAHDILCDQLDQSRKSAETVVATITALLDIVQALVNAELCFRELPAQLLESAFDSLALVECEHLFGWLEQNREKLTSNMGAGLTLLRLCNELLRRLSKGRHAAFSSRILIFLSFAFPLSERSAVNRAGDFNSDKILAIDDSDRGDVMSLPGQVDLSKLASDLWDTILLLQRTFCNPSALRSQAVLTDFMSSLGTMIEAFQQIETLNGFDVGPIAMQAQSFFTSRLLTTRRLLQFELADPTFRRHMLIQALVILAYIQIHGPSAGSLQPTNKSMLPAFSVPLEQVRRAADYDSAICAILDSRKIDSPNLRDLVSAILASDKVWFDWKARSCPAYERPALPSERFAAANEYFAKLSSPKRSWPHAMGSASLSKIWKDGGVCSMEEIIAQPAGPSIDDLYGQYKESQIKAALAGDGDEKAMHKTIMSSRVWCAFRRARESDYDLLADETAGGNLHALLRARAERQARQKENQPLPSIKHVSPPLPLQNFVSPSKRAADEDDLEVNNPARSVENKRPRIV
ncbi:hypothetical protein PYCC9005_001029 [Savitreella phatthalungensis]